jgi:hypothetical protein
MKNDKRMRTWCALALLVLAGGCQFLQNEFTTLNVPPPSVHAVPEPMPW